MPNPSLHPSHPIAELLQADPRYTFEAYVFIFEALNYAQNELGMGKELPRRSASKSGRQDEPERHVCGQDLCEAARQLALEQYGYMAQTVLNRWGIRSTGDLGEIVFNLIRIGHMRKTSEDCREDFDDVFDFHTALRREFKIRLPD